MRGICLAAIGLAGVVGVQAAAAQERTSQPGVLEIVREMVKPGRGGAHQAVEKDWAAFGRHQESPGYIALTSNSGPAEAWFMFGHNSWAAYDSATGYAGKDPTYAAGNRRLAEQDGEQLTGTATILASALPAAGHGAFPDLSKMRIYQVVIFRMRPGMESAFLDLAKGYAAIAKTAPAVAGWRAYTVEAGLGPAPGGTFLVIETFPSWAARAASGQAMEAAIAATPKATMTALQKLGTDAIVNSETRLFTIAPAMSLAPQGWLSDPFWKP